MRKICAWCGLVLQEGPEPTSHGICESCAEKLIQKQKEVSPEVARDEEFASVIFVCGCTYGKGRYITKCWRHDDKDFH